MIYIDKRPNPSGAYPNPKGQPFRDCVTLTDEQAEVFFAYNGFVTLGEDGTVVPNIEAWEVWKSSQTAPEAPAEDPSTEELLTRVAELEEALELILSGKTGEEVAADET